ncbi:MAG: sugar phosphate isomerase/epimerase family protein [Phycisphaerae bacterium]|nr:sugar phosphate isomerase/epimerase family protein [Phycisphaerae bacterium]
MQLGVCAGLDDAAWVKQAGADFLEGPVEQILKPAEPSWNPPVDPAALAVPLSAYNCFFPADLKITGPETDLERIKVYATRVFERARRMQSRIIVLGSGGARTVPDGWPRQRAEEQLVEVLRAIGPIAKAHRITVVIEPLRRQESNILNTVREGLDTIARAGTEGIAVLCDFYHMAVENEPLEHLDGARGLLRHVHIAEPAGRVPPGPGMTDYRPFLAKLRAIGYDGRISLECSWTDMRAQLGPAIRFLRCQWDAA